MPEIDCFNLSLLLSISTVPSVSPLFTENVTEIQTNIFVTSFGPVSDTEMVSQMSTPKLFSVAGQIENLSVEKKRSLNATVCVKSDPKNSFPHAGLFQLRKKKY